MTASRNTKPNRLKNSREELHTMRSSQRKKTKRQASKERRIVLKELNRE